MGIDELNFKIPNPRRKEMNDIGMRGMGKSFLDTEHNLSRCLSFELLADPGDSITDWSFDSMMPFCTGC